MNRFTELCFVFCSATLLGLGTPSHAYDISPLGCATSPNLQCCYTFHNNPVTWSEAESICVQGGSGLARLDSPDKDDIIRKHLKLVGAGQQDPESGGYKEWIGARASGDRHWRWENGHSLNDSQDNVVTFAFPPKDYQGCVAVETSHEVHGGNHNHTFTARQCRSVLNYICQKPVLTAEANNSTNGTDCVVGQHSGVKHSGICYVPYGNDPDSYRHSWTKARSTCQSLGAQLLVLDGLNSSQVELILSLVRPGTYWLGLTCIRWGWIATKHGEMEVRVASFNTTAAPWLLDPPTRPEVMHCLAAGQYDPARGYGWTDERCDDTLPFVCETQIIITTTYPTTEADYHSDRSLNESEKRRLEEAKKEFHLHDWANVIIPITMIGIVAIAALVSVTCYVLQKRKGYTRAD